MGAKPFDSTILGDAAGALDFITNVLEASTEYSIIGKSLDGTILLWNEGARRMYGYDAAEVVGKANSEILHTPEDVALSGPREILGTDISTRPWGRRAEACAANGLFEPWRRSAGGAGERYLHRNFDRSMMATAARSIAHFWRNLKWIFVPSQ
jgi:PAS domain-containing protein